MPGNSNPGNGPTLRAVSGTLKDSGMAPNQAGMEMYLGFSLPDRVKFVRLQIEGTMAGSSYSGSITSNLVEVKIP